MTSLWILILCGLVGSLMADDCCSAEDRRTVRKLWRTLWGSQDSGRRIALSLAVFKDMFEHHPETVDLFKRVKSDDTTSPDFQAHMIRVIGGLDLLINVLDNPAVLKQQLHHLSKQHVNMKSVTKEQIRFIEDSFARVMPHAASIFNADAWNRCFEVIINGITHDL